MSNNDNNNDLMAAGVELVDQSLATTASNPVAAALNVLAWTAGAHMIDNDTTAAGTPYYEATPWSHSVMHPRDSLSQVWDSFQQSGHHVQEQINDWKHGAQVQISNWTNDAWQNIRSTMDGAWNPSFQPTDTDADGLWSTNQAEADQLVYEQEQTRLEIERQQREAEEKERRETEERESQRQAEAQRNDPHYHENCSCDNYVDNPQKPGICKTCDHYGYNHPK